MEQNENKGNGPKKNTIIYVTVDTKHINESEIDKYVVFSDDRDDDPPQKPGRPQDYVSTIEKGMKVYWRGLAKDPNSGDSVEITDIDPKEGKGNWKLLQEVGPERGNEGVKVGKIKNKFIEGQEAYSVKFRVNGGSGVEYMVDPKLQMKY